MKILTNKKAKIIINMVIANYQIAQSAINKASMNMSAEQEIEYIKSLKSNTSDIIFELDGIDVLNEVIDLILKKSCNQN